MQKQLKASNRTLNKYLFNHLYIKLIQKIAIVKKQTGAIFSYPFIYFFQ